MLSNKFTVLSDIQVKHTNCPNIMVGMGLGSGSRRILSHGIPLDLISFLAEADDFRQEKNYFKGIVFIADNPKMYPYSTIHMVKEKSIHLDQTIIKILSLLNLNDWIIVKGTDFCETPYYHFLIDKFSLNVKELMDENNHIYDDLKFNYFVGEICDIEFLRLFFDVRAKFG